jgi:hypothetical protein
MGRIDERIQMKRDELVLFLAAIANLKKSPLTYRDWMISG